MSLTLNGNALSPRSSGGQMVGFHFPVFVKATALKRPQRRQRERMERDEDGETETTRQAQKNSLSLPAFLFITLSAAENTLNEMALCRQTNTHSHRKPRVGLHSHTLKSPLPPSRPFPAPILCCYFSKLSPH